MLQFILTGENVKSNLVYFVEKFRFKENSFYLITKFLDV